MKPGKRKETGAVLIEAVRIAVGSGAAMYAASLLHLEFAASAGMVTLLTILTTKWETLRLSAARILTFILAAVLAGLVFSHIKSDGAAFGIFIFTGIDKRMGRLEDNCIRKCGHRHTLFGYTQLFDCFYCK